MTTLRTNSILDLSSRTLVNTGSGSIIAVSTSRNDVRQSMPSVASFVAVRDNFRKLRSDTHIIATSTVYGAGYFSGNCGVGMIINNTTWDHGCGYQYDGSWSATAQVTIVTGTSRWSSIPAGLINIGWGWTVANGQANRPFNFLNPNTADADPRNQQFISTIIVYEVIP
jgi:hypothetical protein